MLVAKPQRRRRLRSAISDTAPGRDRGFRLLWRLAWPLRLYVRRSPLPYGKGVICRRALLPLTPRPPATLLAPVSGGGDVRLFYRETIGFSVLLHGSFEQAESDYLCRLAQPGGTVVDVGANVGLHTIPLALAVGTGKVMAFEPVPENVKRLQENVERNRLRNVEIYPFALSDEDGSATMHLSRDPAYGTLMSTAVAHVAGESIETSTRRLDDVWRMAGQPAVSAIKVDVEGAELRVLRGAKDLLATCRPVLLVEAAQPAERAVLEDWLSALAYKRLIRSDFEPWNQLFIHGDLQS